MPRFAQSQSRGRPVRSRSGQNRPLVSGRRRTGRTAVRRDRRLAQPDRTGRGDLRCGCRPGFCRQGVAGLPRPVRTTGQAVRMHRTRPGPHVGSDQHRRSSCLPSGPAWSAREPCGRCPTNPGRSVAGFGRLSPVEPHGVVRPGGVGLARPALSTPGSGPEAQGQAAVADAGPILCHRYGSVWPVLLLDPGPQTKRSGRWQLPVAEAGPVVGLRRTAGWARPGRAGPRPGSWRAGRGPSPHRDAATNRGWPEPG